MGRKHYRRFEGVCGSFLELKEVVTRQALRFLNGFRGRAVKYSVLNDQGSSLVALVQKG